MMTIKYLAKIKLFVTLAFAVFAISACSSAGDSERDSIALARQEINDGNFDSAADILDAIVKNLGDSIKSPKAVGEMAVLYMIIDEHQTEEGHNAKALDLYRRAVTSNADSVNALFSELESADARYLFMLKNLDAQNGGQIDLSDFDEYDEESEEGEDSPEIPA